MVEGVDRLLETERTRLRPWKESEADRVYDIYSRWEVSRWLGAEPKVMASREEAEKAIARFAERGQQGDGYGFWAVERKEDGVVAGTQLLVPLKGGEHGEVEIGWHFHPDSWGKGLASESAVAVRDFGWHLGLTEMHAVVFAGNDASMAVCRRLGMEHLGSTRQFYDVDLEHFRVFAP
jgi:RimJ/RimL family protein N-acetyltransferase